LIDAVRARWRDTTPAEVAKLAGEIGRWQEALVRFQSVGHMKSWMVPVDPLVTSQEIRFELPGPAAGDEVTLYLAAGEAGDENKHDTLIWQQPRLVTPGQPDLPLRDVRHVVHELTGLRARVSTTAAGALAAADEASQAPGPINVEELAGKHGIDADVLTAWLDYLGISATGDIKLNYLTGRIEQSAGYNFVQGWGTHETPLLVANSSDRHVRVPGNMKPHGVAVHPSPALAAAIAWRSPISGGVKVTGKVTSAHPECGNGVTWSLELRRGHTRQVLASGTATGSAAGTIALETALVVRPDDLVALAVGPRGGNHACDLTDVELVLTSTSDDAREWTSRATWPAIFWPATRKPIASAILRSGISTASRPRSPAPPRRFRRLLFWLAGSRRPRAPRNKRWPRRFKSSLPRAPRPTRRIPMRFSTARSRLWADRCSMRPAVGWPPVASHRVRPPPAFRPARDLASIRNCSAVIPTARRATPRAFASRRHRSSKCDCRPIWRPAPRFSPRRFSIRAAAPMEAYS
jgi:hypothetical protein